MKFLHTSDLHIGRKLDGIPRLGEQKDVLEEIARIADDELVDVVLVAGDVFDTFIPSAEAENAFFEFAERIAGGKRAVVVIPGNHDDAERLNASRRIAQKRGLLLCGGEFVFDRNSFGEISVSDSGKNYIVLKKGDESVYIATVPYFSEAPAGEAVNRDETYDERHKRVIAEAFSHNAEKYPQILVGHLFMLGGESSGSERPIDLGGARIVSPTVIPSDCLYTALGHLHKRQIVSKSANIVYSGAPLEYAYDEAGTEKSVELFGISGGELRERKTVSLSCGKKLAAVSAVGFENAGKALEGLDDKYVMLTIFTDRPLGVEETKELRSSHPNITQLRLELTGGADGGRIVGRKHLSDEKLFEEYFKARYGGEPDAELMALYKEIMSED